MLLQSTPNSFPTFSQRKAQITHTHHIQNILLWKEHALRAMLITENIPTQSAVMFALPKRM